MRKIYFNIISMSMLFFVIWLFALAFKNGFNLSGIRLNLYATVKRFETVTSGNWQEMLNSIVENFSRLNFDTNFQYVQFNSISSFFQNIGIWFNGVFSLISNFITSIGLVIVTICRFFVFYIQLILGIFNFLFNPVQL